MGRLLRLGVGVAAAGVTAIAASAETYPARSVEVERFIGTVRVVGHADASVQVVISGPAAGAYRPAVRLDADTVRIDGGQSLGNISCRRDERGMVIAHRSWRRSHPITSFPVITVHAPRDVALRIRRSLIAGSADQLGAADLELAGCGDFNVAGVAGRLDLGQAGSGVTRIGPVEDAHVSVAGSGSIALGAVGGVLHVDIAGSGSVSAGPVRAADLSTAGSGSISVARVEGPVEISVVGSGLVEIGGGRATSFEASTAGSGDVVFRGVAVNPDVDIVGSGSVRIGAVEGQLGGSRAGSGSVTIGDR